MNICDIGDDILVLIASFFQFPEDFQNYLLISPQFAELQTNPSFLNICSKLLPTYTCYAPIYSETLVKLDGANLPIFVTLNDGSFWNLNLGQKRFFEVNLWREIKKLKENKKISEVVNENKKINENTNLIESNQNDININSQQIMKNQQNKEIQDETIDNLKQYEETIEKQQNQQEEQQIQQIFDLNKQTESDQYKTEQGILYKKERVLEVKAGIRHVLALCEGGRLYSSGFNHFSQCGHREQLRRNRPSYYYWKHIATFASAEMSLIRERRITNIIERKINKQIANYLLNDIMNEQFNDNSKTIININDNNVKQNYILKDNLISNKQNNLIEQQIKQESPFSPIQELSSFSPLSEKSPFSEKSPLYPQSQKSYSSQSSSQSSQSFISYSPINPHIDFNSFQLTNYQTLKQQKSSKQQKSRQKQKSRQPSQQYYQSSQKQSQSQQIYSSNNNLLSICPFDVLFFGCGAYHNCVILKYQKKIMIKDKYQQQDQQFETTNLNEQTITTEQNKSTHKQPSIKRQGLKHFIQSKRQQISFNSLQQNNQSVLLWGRNDSGQLGTGDKEERDVPVDIGNQNKQYDGKELGQQEDEDDEDNEDSNKQDIKLNEKVKENDQSQLNNKIKNTQKKQLLMERLYINQQSNKNINQNNSSSNLIPPQSKKQLQSDNNSNNTSIKQNRSFSSLFSSVQNPFRSEIVTQFAGGYFHSLFLTETGRVFACGDNTQGQLGIGDVGNRVQYDQQDNFNLEDKYNEINNYDNNFNLEKLKNNQQKNKYDVQFQSFQQQQQSVQQQIQYSSQQQQQQSTSEIPPSFDIPEFILTPVPLPRRLFGFSPIKFIKSGFSHSSAITLEGRIYVWGYNFFRQLVSSVSPTVQIQTQPILFKAKIIEDEINKLEQNQQQINNIKLIEQNLLESTQNIDEILQSKKHIIERNIDQNTNDQEIKEEQQQQQQVIIDIAHFGEGVYMLDKLNRVWICGKGASYTVEEENYFPMKVDIRENNDQFDKEKNNDDFDKEKNNEQIEDIKKDKQVEFKVENEKEKENNDQFDKQKVNEQIAGIEKNKEEELKDKQEQQKENYNLIKNNENKQNIEIIENNNCENQTINIHVNDKQQEEQKYSETQNSNFQQQYVLNNNFCYNTNSQQIINSHNNLLIKFSNSSIVSTQLLIQNKREIPEYNQNDQIINEQRC